ncbi:MAG: ATP-binding protein [Candidatus Altiarchaeota archaeon]|nr:ATP-binding protein [Candidatus Altiarchaeota archaeon]
MRPIVIGRDVEDLKKFGEDGLAALGKHYVRTGDRTNLANDVLLDLARPHIILVSGKRGQGKSYTLGVIAEEIIFLPRRLREKLSVVIFDTMGIYWTMKFPNARQERDIKKWGLEPKSMPARVLIPKGWTDQYKKSGIEVDGLLAIHPTDLTVDDWIQTFDIGLFSPLGILLERVLKKKPSSLSEMVSFVEADKRSERSVKDGLLNRLSAAESWGVFSDEGTKVSDLLAPGTINVLDLSLLGTRVKSLLIGLISKKIFEARVIARKGEEKSEIIRHMDIAKETKSKIPMPWILIDEAHEYLPPKLETPSARALIQVIREGRQPGITLVLATQQPGKIHTDVMTQADIVISHRVTAELDIEALNSIMGNYMQFPLEKYISSLPRYKGAAVILDDNAEKVYQIRMRPRVSWHGGESATLIK